RQNAMWCWGDNTYGQLGNGTSGNSIPSPEPVRYAGGSALADVIEIGAGDAYACALLRSGDVWCWGDNAIGQLATGITGPGSAVPVKALLPAPARHLSVGNSHACVVLPDDRVACWGGNEVGELGYGTVGGQAPTPQYTLPLCD